MTVSPLKVAVRDASTARREPATHLFAVGQAVRFKGGFGLKAGPTEIFRVTRTLPPRGNSPQYRIRNEEERHERVTSQDDLEGVPSTPDQDTLIERTFGHG
ncbi:hypothetical protein [Aquibium sp. ELW1220]|jgi:hypothetical protein|uniref:hypothetical protein n=1 Tax=Aquibium sp. ELW1220 TaxID=2976766 RepID=UPI0025B04F11|nr:hypothetical protein [Aquibium sp. ELW1220]MDN2580218.1 hypothetical protein [Aquibium sp. ELW1220]